jgi:hypothetical protein
MSDFTVRSASDLTKQQQQQQQQRQPSPQAQAQASRASAADIPSRGQLTLAGLQQVFGSSQVSSASLDYLSTAAILDEDYADIK